jgi:enoyl-CoA hydratase/carnithine racemase
MTMLRLRPSGDLDFKEILYKKENWVARITINRPHAFNSFTTVTISELQEALLDASRDENVAVIVLTAAGKKAFCTGADINEFSGTHIKNSTHKYRQVVGDVFDTIKFITESTKPTIALVNGAAVGGGNELQAACDLAIASEENAYFMQVGTKVGSVPAGGATQWLPIIVGERRAKEMIYLCEKVDPHKALEWGLINQVVPHDKLDEAAHEMCEKIINKFPECMRYTKVQTNFWKDLSWNLTAPHALDWLTLHVKSRETREGMTSFAEKRPTEYMKAREQSLRSETIICPACNADDIPDGFAYCGYCGEKIPASND